MMTQAIPRPRHPHGYSVTLCPFVEMFVDVADLCYNTGLFVAYECGMPNPEQDTLAVPCGRQWLTYEPLHLPMCPACGQVACTVDSCWSRD